MPNKYANYANITNISVRISAGLSPVGRMINTVRCASVLNDVYGTMKFSLEDIDCAINRVFCLPYSVADNIISAEVEEWQKPLQLPAIINPEICITDGDGEYIAAEYRTVILEFNWEFRPSSQNCNDVDRALREFKLKREFNLPSSKDEPIPLPPDDSGENWF